ncbi:hypothetical protein MYX77_06735 [Acidobacteriia bacterium AH_259_A11_L15]|nr:hypothetical protein [Acidobacteriia bacterium AH_259_A11_L15]
MSTDSVLRLSYWGGWVSMGVALIYKLLIVIDVVAATQAVQMNLLPRHFWQMSFLLFVICLASDALARRKSA